MADAQSSSDTWSRIFKLCLVSDLEKICKFSQGDNFVNCKMLAMQIFSLFFGLRVASNEPLELGT
jgi:hypothetical protein